MAFKTKPRGIHANFAFDCPKCGTEATVSNGRPDPHTCREPKPITLADLRAALDRRP